MIIQQELLTPGAERGRSTRLLKPEGVVIHWVGNAGSTAINNRNYFERGSDGRKVSYHYIVGLDGEIIQCVPENERAAHAGATANIKYIGIGVCHPKMDGIFADVTYESLVWLVADICERYGLNVNGKVLRHYDITKKICPLRFVRFPSEWEKFKEDVSLRNVNIKYLDLLFANANSPGILDKRLNNGISKLSDALSVLFDAGVMNSPEYWLNVTKRFIHMEELLINMANQARIVLEKIIHAEARGEDLKGQILVGNVIQNRKAHPQFPNEIYDIIFQPNQFQPIRNGAYKAALPSNSVKTAVDMLLDGVDYSRGALYFRSTRGAEGSWHEQSLTRLFTHGGHIFYK